MATSPNFVEILKRHKAWADRYLLIWELIIFLLFVGAYVLMDLSDFDAATDTDAFILLATMVLAAVIWQGIGLGVARVHMLLHGIDPGNDPMREGR